MPVVGCRGRTPFTRRTFTKTPRAVSVRQPGSAGWKAGAMVSALPPISKVVASSEQAPPRGHDWSFQTSICWSRRRHRFCPQTIRRGRQRIRSVPPGRRSRAVAAQHAAVRYLRSAEHLGALRIQPRRLAHRTRDQRSAPRRVAGARLAYAHTSGRRTSALAPPRPPVGSGTARFSIR